MKLARGFAFVLSLSCAIPELAAQCAPAWQPGIGATGTLGSVDHARLWDPDGAGPLSPRLLLGGGFLVAGSVVGNHLVAVDTQTGQYSSFGSGLTGSSQFTSVRTTTTMPNGDLVVGGLFTSAGGVPAANIARWNGSAWASMGSWSNWVLASAATTSGDVFAGGTASGVRRWSGSSWVSIGGPITNGVHVLVGSANGTLVACGYLGSSFSTSVVARWNGTSWTNLGTCNGNVYSAIELPNGDLIVGGEFASVNGVMAPGLARWNGSSWSSIGGGLMFGSLNGTAYALSQTTAGGFAVFGYFLTAGGVASRNAAVWTGSAWVAVTPALPDYVQAGVVLPNGNLVAAGIFESVAGIQVNNVAEWSAAGWRALGSLNDGAVSTLFVTANGDLVVGGRFQHLGGVAANRIVRRTATTWSPIGSGMNGPVQAVVELANGDLVAGGDFTMAGGVPVSQVALWNGSAWQPLGSPGGPVLALEVLPNGDLVAGGRYFGVVRWTGSSWQQLGPALTGVGGWLPPEVQSLRSLPDGRLAVGGNFSGAGSVPGTTSLALWNGTAWEGSGLVSAGSTTVPGMALDDDGNLIVALSSGGVHRRSGATGMWTPVGSVPAVLRAVVCLPDGDLLVGGIDSTGQTGVLLRWNGSSWLSAGSPDRVVHALAATDAGSMFVGGEFGSFSGTVSASLAEAVSTCPASAVSSTSGCPLPSAAPSLGTEGLPWVGGRFECVGTGWSPGTTAAFVFGFNDPASPLDLVHPSAPPGCLLRASPDVFGFAPSSPETRIVVQVPNSVSLVGSLLFVQFLQVAFDANGDVLGLAGSNGLALTIGAF